MPELFNVHGFEPPEPVTVRSLCPRVDHGVSGLLPTTERALNTRFRYGCMNDSSFSLAADSNSPVHYAKGTPSRVAVIADRHSAPTARKCRVSGAFNSARRRAFHRSIALLVHYRSSRSI